jgi:uncharacterized protein
VRIGFDVDGVLADFPTTYQKLVVEVTGQNLFHEGDAENPPAWDWAAYRGYRSEDIGRVWGTIKRSPSFWYGLGPLDGCTTLSLVLPALEDRHDVYFVTSRPGATAKRQSEAWLYRHLPYRDMGLHPTVLISSAKGAAAKALALDCYLDDNRDNAIDVAVSSTARSYLLDRPYNQGSLPRGVARVTTVGEFFDRELSNL